MSNYLSQGHSSGAGVVTEALTLSMALSQKLYTVEQMLKTNLCTEQQEAGVASSDATKSSLQMQSGTMIARGIEQAVCGLLQGAAMGISKLYSNFSESGKLATSYETELQNNEDFMEELVKQSKNPNRAQEVQNGLRGAPAGMDQSMINRNIQEKLVNHSFALTTDGAGKLVNSGAMKKTPLNESAAQKSARWSAEDFSHEELIKFAANDPQILDTLTRKWDSDLNANKVNAARQRQTVQAYEKIITDIGDMFGKLTQMGSSGGQATLTWLQGTQDASRTLNDMITNLAKTTSDQTDGISQQQLSALNQLEQALQTWISTSQRPA